jgi:hypothetical protein
MTITNGYCTLNDMKHALHTAALSYTAATIAFDAGTSKLTDSASGLKRFGTNAVIRISGSASNNRDFTVTTGNVAGQLILSPAPTSELAGASITITDVTDLDDDTRIERVVEAASRAIDAFTRRRFYAATETRYFSAAQVDTLFVSDLLTVTTLKTDTDGDRVFETTWATTDYDLLPLNAALDGEPYIRLETAPNGSKTFPRRTKGVEIAGSWGYASAAPALVREACIRWGQRIWMIRDAVLGVKGSTPLGEVVVRNVPPDKDIVAWLQPFRKVSI